MISTTATAASAAGASARCSPGTARRSIRPVAHPVARRPIGLLTGMPEQERLASWHLVDAERHGALRGRGVPGVVPAARRLRLPSRRSPREPRAPPIAPTAGSPATAAAGASWSATERSAARTAGSRSEAQPAASARRRPVIAKANIAASSAATMPRVARYSAPVPGDQVADGLHHVGGRVEGGDRVHPAAEQLARDVDRREEEEEEDGHLHQRRRLQAAEAERDSRRRTAVR